MRSQQGQATSSLTTQFAFVWLKKDAAGRFRVDSSNIPQIARLRSAFDNEVNAQAVVLARLARLGFEEDRVLFNPNIPGASTLARHVN
jgi:hypothetical protein